MSNNQKELIQYSTAIFGILSGIVMCFLSFFLNEYEITASALGYLGEFLIFGASIFGLSIYVKSSVLEASSKMEKNLEQKLEDKFKEEEEKVS